MKQFLLCLQIPGLALALTGCSAITGQNGDADVRIGGEPGSQSGQGRGRTADIIAGSLIGAANGGNVGRAMDETDRANLAGTLEAVRTGVTSSWRNPDTGNSYSVVPFRTILSIREPCREYNIAAIIGGIEEQEQGRACRLDDGSWVIQNRNDAR